jgi:hypothetical protein
MLGSRQIWRRLSPDANRSAILSAISCVHSAAGRPLGRFTFTISANSVFAFDAAFDNKRSTALPSRSTDMKDQPMRVAIVGSRRRTDQETIASYVRSLPDETIVISGACEGAATLQAAFDRGFSVASYLNA